MEMQTIDNSTRAVINETAAPVLVVDKHIFRFYLCMFIGFIIFVIFLLYKCSVNSTLLRLH